MHSLTENQAQGKKGVTGLLQKAQFFAAEDGATTAKGENQSPPPKSGGKLSGFFQKVKRATGFSDDPPGTLFS